MDIQSPVFDAVRYKQTTHEQWQTVAEAWHRWTPTIREWLMPVTDAMVDLGRIRQGNRVLEIAAGAGDPSLIFAKIVGPTGHVLATDLSANILALAAREAEQLGLRNYQTQVMDGEEISVPSESFDVVTSRVGLIYFPDQQRALAAMRQALKPGGRVVHAVYTTAERNGFFSVPISIIRRRAQLPPPLPGQPGPFSLGDDHVLEDAFLQAGFTDVESRVVPAPLRMSSVEECMRFERESFGALHQMLSGLPEPERASVWEEIDDAMRQFEGPQGLEAPGELIVCAGVK